MMSNNKILTVSYGTFSCTLEGFDDSFGTMKAIAEYFRDLASDDRYFGAEPPQPDAEMLARIAQKEISRRVEAREHEGKIVLSAAHGDAPRARAIEAPEAAPAAPVGATKPAPEPTDAPAPEAPAHQPLAAEAAPAPETPVAQAPEAPAPAVEPTPAAEDSDDGDIDSFFVNSGTSGITAEEDPDGEIDETPARPVESIAAKLQRIRAVVSQQETSFAEDTEEEEAPAASMPQDDAARDFAQGEDAPEEEPVQENAAQDDAPAELPEAAEDETAQDAVTEPAAEAEQEDHATTAETEEPEDTAEAEEDAQDVIATADPVLMSDPVAAARRDIEDALDADDAADETARAEEDDEDEEDDIAAILARLDQADARGRRGTMRFGASNGTGSAGQIDEGDLSAIQNLFGLAEADDEAQDEEEEDETARATAPRSSATGTEVRASAEARGTADPLGEEEAEPKGRIITVNRDALDAAMAKGEVEAYDPAEDNAEAGDEQKAEKPAAAQDEGNKARQRKLRKEEELRKTSSLTKEEEDELARELAQVEADDRALKEAQAKSRETAQNEAAEKAAAPSDGSSAEEHAAVRAAARAVLPEIEDGTDTNMSRLMAETDHQMDEPESATRRDAFAHLRAAVASKKADQAMGGSNGSGDDEDGAYRSDLAEVVRPRRPATSPEGSRHQRPGEGRPAPLKLVAEQRIDTARPRPAGPVSPRRVAAVAEVTEDTDSSFADFAAEMGATRLPDLLEAAAAYIAFVEGKEQFSRPQLMTKVRQADAPEFSREDGLRSFGQLLRAGKIEKIKGGQFTVSDDIGFKPDQRAAG